MGGVREYFWDGMVVYQSLWQLHYNIFLVNRLFRLNSFQSQHPHGQPILQFLLHHFFLYFLQLGPNNPFPLDFILTPKLVLILQIVRLVEFGDPPIIFEE
jgi:hypothetical protein